MDVAHDHQIFLDIVFVEQLCFLTAIRRHLRPHGFAGADFEGADEVGPRDRPLWTLGQALRGVYVDLSILTKDVLLTQNASTG